MAICEAKMWCAALDVEIFRCQGTLTFEFLQIARGYPISYRHLCRTGAVAASGIHAKLMRSQPTASDVQPSPSIWRSLVYVFGGRERQAKRSMMGISERPKPDSFGTTAKQQLLLQQRAAR